MVNKSAIPIWATILSTSQGSGLGNFSVMAISVTFDHAKRSAWLPERRGESVEGIINSSSLIKVKVKYVLLCLPAVQFHRTEAHQAQHVKINCNLQETISFSVMM